MNEKRGLLIKRTTMMLVGILFISICVGCYRLSGFGVDAFTCMNLGISGFIGMTFGTWQLIMNILILNFLQSGNASAPEPLSTWSASDTGLILSAGWRRMYFGST